MICCQKSQFSDITLIKVFILLNCKNQENCFFWTIKAGVPALPKESRQRKTGAVGVSALYCIPYPEEEKISTSLLVKPSTSLSPQGEKLHVVLLNAKTPLLASG